MSAAKELPADGLLGYSADGMTRALPGVSRSRAYEIAREIGVRVGRRIIVPREALEAWLRSRPPAKEDQP
jgi:hypothetical protein